MPDNVKKLKVDPLVELHKKLNVKKYNPEEKQGFQQVKYWVPFGEYTWWRHLTGVKDLPGGQIISLVSQRENSGKTTVLMHMMVAAQEAGHPVYLFEPEAKFDFDRFELMGGNLENLYYFEDLTSLEEVWNSIFLLIDYTLEHPNDPVPMIAWDSVAASVPDAIIREKDSGDAHFAVEAKINNKNIRKARQSIKKTNILLVLINHIYFPPKSFSDPYPEPIIKHGAELGFMSAIIISFKKGAKITRKVTSNGIERTEKFGQYIKAEAIKGHVSGRTSTIKVPVIDRGIVTPEEVKEYQSSLRGKL